MAVELTYNSEVTVKKTLEGAYAGASSPIVVYDGLNTRASLTASTSVPVTKSALFIQGLTSGTATIDLTSVTDVYGEVVNFNGLKIQAFKVKGYSNAAAITLTEGASNGYELGGNTWKVAVQAGQEFTFYGNELTPDVGGSTKTIDLSGTGTQQVLIEIVGG